MTQTVETETCGRCGNSPKSHHPTDGCPYNGWTNYETWAAALWIGNEQSTYITSQSMAGQAWKDAETPTEWNAYQAREERATHKLSNMLKDWIEEQDPLAENPSLFSDLLSAALSEVNWYEIAEHFIEDLPEEVKQP